MTGPTGGRFFGTLRRLLRRAGARAAKAGALEQHSTLEEALRQVEVWIGSPSVVVIAEGPEHWNTLATVVRAGSIRGPKVHDARIASFCLDSGVTEFLTHAPSAASPRCASAIPCCRRTEGGQDG